MSGSDMRSFWNARAREDAYYFVDTRQRYKSPDPQHFWDAAPLLDFVLDGLGVQVHERDTALEIGCGLGRITRVLAARAAEVIALDVSDEMLRRARELNPELANVNWLAGDGTTLAPMTDGSVDCCVSMVVFQHLPDPNITLGYVREIGRVLRAGGWAALQVSNDPSVHRARTPPRRWVAAVMGRAPRGQSHPAWLGSAVELGALAAVAQEDALEIDKISGEGTQYCQVLLRKRS